MYKCQSELERKIRELSETISQEMKLELNVIMFRDYLAKIEVINEFQDVLLIFNLYYSPKKKAYRIVIEKANDIIVRLYVEKLFGQATSEKEPVKEIKEDVNTIYSAYVDGSYIDHSVGYGAVVLKKDEIVEKLSGHVDGGKEFRQVTGELRAVLEVIKYCENNQIETIKVFYDYTGIREWAVDARKANNELTRSYKKEVQATDVKIIWNKVDAHTGDYYNDMADELAKRGARKI
jgi:ribonuclease HI